MNWGTTIAALALVIHVTGCGGTNSNGECTPGASVACTGTGGCAGAQVCSADGESFGACQCSPVDGGQMDTGQLDGGADDAGPDGSLDGGGDGSVDDGGRDASTGPCDLVEQTGCDSGQRCVWVEDGLGGGEAECASDGTIAALGECSAAEPGEVDECVAGHACLTGMCFQLCSTNDDQCGADFICQRFFGFVDDDATGACVPRCDPVSQVRLHDDAAACGSPTPNDPTLGCYGQLTGPFTCGRVAPGAGSQTHGTTPIGSSTGPFLSGCAPGNMPFATDVNGTLVFDCRALCTPAPTVMGSDAQRQGAAPHTCPAHDASATTVECRYGSFFSINPGQVPTTLGVCVDPSLKTYDHDMDPQTDPIAWPSCSTLTSGDLDGDELPDAQAWGCTPLP